MKEFAVWKKVTVRMGEKKKFQVNYVWKITDELELCKPRINGRIIFRWML
jgi:hypothetical protein